MPDASPPLPSSLMYYVSTGTFASVPDHVAAAVRLVPAAERGDGHRRRGRGRDRGHRQCHGAGAVSAMSELVLGSCGGCESAVAATASRVGAGRVVQRVVVRHVLAAGTIAPLDQLAKAPCVLPSTSSRGAGARMDVPIRAPSANITWATVRRRGQPHSWSGNFSGTTELALHNGWPRRSLRARPCSTAVSRARWHRNGGNPVLPDRVRGRRCFDRLGEAVESHF